MRGWHQGHSTWVSPQLVPLGLCSSSFHHPSASPMRSNQNKASWPPTPKVFSNSSHQSLSLSLQQVSSSYRRAVPRQASVWRAGSCSVFSGLILQMPGSKVSTKKPGSTTKAKNLLLVFAFPIPVLSLMHISGQACAREGRTWKPLKGNTLKPTF